MREVLSQGKVFILRYNNLMEDRIRQAGKNRSKINIPVWGWIVLIALVGIIWKAIWLWAGAFPFNSDEAITGLMARHILQGERPIFFYGQVYMGSLDAFLTAGLFTLLGDSVLIIRVLQAILYTCTIITTAWLGRKLTGEWETGLLAAGLMAVPVVNVTLYTTTTLGGYGEALVLSNGAFLCAMELISDADKANQEKVICLSGLLGFITGLGFWVLGITLVSTVPAVIFSGLALWKRRKTIPVGFVSAAAIFLVIFVLGSLPWWFATMQAGFFNQIRELFGSAVSIEKENWFVRSGNHLLYFLFLGLPAAFGLRPPWEVRWLALPLLPFILIIWGAVFWKFPGILRKETPAARSGWGMLVASAGLLAAGFVFTSFGLDPSGRYFLPLAVPLALAAARVIIKAPVPRLIRFITPVVLILFSIIGTVQSAITPPGITTQFDRVSWIDHRYDRELIDFLMKNGETHGYTNYWVAYPLAYESNETIIFSPRLPYHEDLRYTERDDRIPAYTNQVDRSDRTAYITTFNPNLDKALASGFTRLGITWQEKSIGDFHIYFGLSRPVRPAELQNELTPING
jgi:4-amino-4-deoxy-L-arabinose transferase-like glycosyltransferase